MSRARAVIAAAVTEVVAAEVYTQLNTGDVRITREQARAAAVAAVEAVAADGWHISALPPPERPTGALTLSAARRRRWARLLPAALTALLAAATVTALHTTTTAATGTARPAPSPNQEPTP